MTKLRPLLDLGIGRLPKKGWADGSNIVTFPLMVRWLSDFTATLPAIASRSLVTVRDDVLRSELTGLTPRLRRYARALTNGAAGASELADDLVHATLMRALGARHIGGMSELLIRLYATVTQLHREIGVSGQQARAAVAGSPVLIATAPRSPATRQTHLSSGLLGLPLEAREALLLVGLEGFDYAEAARILRISRSVLIGRLTQARTALDAALRMDACRNDVGQGELRQGNAIHNGAGQVVHASEPGNRQRRPRAPYLRLVT